MPHYRHGYVQRDPTIAATPTPTIAITTTTSSILGLVTIATILAGVTATSTSQQHVCP